MSREKQRITPHERNRYFHSLTQAHNDVRQSLTPFMELALPGYQKALRYRPQTPEGTQLVLGMRLKSEKYHTEVLSQFTHYYQIDQAGKTIEQTRQFIAAKTRRGQESSSEQVSPFQAIVTDFDASLLESDLLRIQEIRSHNPVPDLHGAPSPRDIFSMSLVKDQLIEKDRKAIETVFTNTTDPHMIAYMNYLMVSGLSTQMYSNVLDKSTYQDHLAADTIRYVNEIGKKMKAFLTYYMIEVFRRTQETGESPLFPENSALPMAVAHYHSILARGIAPSVYRDLITFDFIPQMTQRAKTYAIHKFEQEHEEANATLISRTDSNGKNPYALAKQLSTEEKIAYTSSLISFAQNEDPTNDVHHPLTTVNRNYEALKTGLGHQMHTIPVEETDLIDTIDFVIDQSRGYMNLYVVGKQTLLVQISPRGEAYGFLAENTHDSFKFFRFLLGKFLTYCQSKNIQFTQTPQETSMPIQPTVPPSLPIMAEQIHPQRIRTRTSGNGTEMLHENVQKNTHYQTPHVPVRRDTSTPIFKFGSKELERALHRLGFQFRNVSGSHKVAWHPEVEVTDPLIKNITIDRKREYTIPRRHAFYNQLLQLGFTQEQIRDAFK